MKGLQLLLTPFDEGTGEDFLNSEGFPEPHPVHLTKNFRVEELPKGLGTRASGLASPARDQGWQEPKSLCHQSQCRP